jgi:hypothetical protein
MSPEHQADSDQTAQSTPMEKRSWFARAAAIPVAAWPRRSDVRNGGRSTGDLARVPPHDVWLKPALSLPTILHRIHRPGSPSRE